MCFYQIVSVLRTCSDKRNGNYLMRINLNAELEGAKPGINVTPAHCAVPVSKGSRRLGSVCLNEPRRLAFSSKASDVD
jgi:hypothetical protein